MASGGETIAWFQAVTPCGSNVTIQRIPIARDGTFTAGERSTSAVESGRQAVRSRRRTEADPRQPGGQRPRVRPREAVRRGSQLTDAAAAPPAGQPSVASSRCSISAGGERCQRRGSRARRRTARSPAATVAGRPGLGAARRSAVRRHCSAFARAAARADWDTGYVVATRSYIAAVARAMRRASLEFETAWPSR